jgi:hypothetical protein
VRTTTDIEIQNGGRLICTLENFEVLVGIGLSKFPKKGHEGIMVGMYSN